MKSALMKVYLVASQNTCVVLPIRTTHFFPRELDAVTVRGQEYGESEPGWNVPVHRGCGGSEPPIDEAVPLPSEKGRRQIGQRA